MGPKNQPANQQQADGKQAAKVRVDQSQNQDGTSQTDNGKAGQPSNPNENEITNQAEAVQPAESSTVDDLLLHTIGSIDPASPYRYLITVNPLGGSIRRIELNFRQPGKKSFKYRDLEDTSGYLGCLDCLDTPQGCLVRAVGNGTPADNAVAADVSGGIKAGDLLVAFDGQRIISAADFERLLKTTKSGQKIELSVNRLASRKVPVADLGKGKEIKFSVELIRKPIELLRPEHNEYMPDKTFPESFLVSLLKPMTVQDLVWPELDQRATNQPWQVNLLNESEIEVSYKLDPDKLRAMGFEPLTIVKRYRLPKVEETQRNLLNARTFHFELDVEVINESDQKQSVTMELDGPTGANTETWWYTQKIHGRSTAIGYSAGARDVIGSTQYEQFIFLGCPEIATGAAAANKYPQYICSPHLNAAEARQLNFVGVDTQYFNISLIPKTEGRRPLEVNSVTAYPNGGIVARDTKYHRLTDCTFQLFKTINLDGKARYQQTFEIFAGPKESVVLPQYGLDDTRTFGWFAWLSKPLLGILHFFYWITGSFSYGIAIVLLTVLVRSLMIPISHKAAVNAQMMQLLQPQMQEIREKFKDSPEKQGLATRELFRKYRYNPLSGCFLGLLQLPIFLGLYRGLSVDIALRDQPLVSGMKWCNNLSGPDQLLHWADWMPLSDKLSFFGPYLNVLPLITVALFLVQQKMFMPPPTDDQQRLMQKMMTFMMIFMGFLFFKVASGLCIYFITSSVWGILERKLLPKPTIDLEKFQPADDKSASGGLIAKIMAMQEKSRAPQQDREAEMAERKQKNADRKKRLKKRET